MRLSSSRPNSTRIARLILLAWLVGAPVTAAGPGTPDPDFGIQGKLLIAFNLGGDFIDSAHDVAIQSDGKAIVVGSAQFGSGDYDLALVRFDKTGTFDSTFAGTGGTTVAFDLGQSNADYAQAVAVQPDGKIVVAGYVQVAQGLDGAVARLLPNGSLDTSFDSDGKTTIPFDLGETNQDLFVDLALQPDGKIVVVGTADHFPFNNDDCIVARLLADGSLDTSFDGDGKAVVGFEIGGTLHDDCHAVQVQSDGKIVIVGTASGDTKSHIALARLSANGELDASFGTGGKKILDFDAATSEVGRALGVMPDDRLVVGGFSFGLDISRAALARLTADGTLDASFATDGMQTVDVSGKSETLQDLAIQPDRKVAFVMALYDGSQYDFAAGRLNADGSIDTGYGSGGVQIIAFDLGGDQRDYANAIAQRSDGTTILAGSVQQTTGDDADFGVVQLIGDGFIFVDGFEGGDVTRWSASVP